MPSPISSFLTIILISSIILLFPSPSNSTSSPSNSTSPSNLIKKVCYINKPNFSVKSCYNLLQNTPKVAAAKDFRQLTIGLIEGGITRSDLTRRHVKSLLKNSTTDSELKEALKECKSAYDWTIGSFSSALGEVKENEYETASYDVLLAATDCIRGCLQAVSAKGIDDGIIIRGNKVAAIFGMTAFEAVERI